MKAHAMRLLVLVCASILAVPAAANAAGGTEARERAVVAAFVDGYARPAYGRLHDAASALQAAAVRYCANPGEATRDGLDHAFGDVVTAWAHVDFLRIGPATQNARLERFAFSPDPRGFVERQLRPLLAGSEGEAIDLAGLAGRSAAVQGLPAFERLLMVDVSADTADLPRRCRLGGLIAANLEMIAAELDAGWASADGIARALTTPGPHNAHYRSPAEGATEVLKAALTAVEQTRDIAIAPALGTTPEAAKPNRLPFARSGFAVAYLSASVSAVGGLILASGLADDLSADDAWAKNSVLFELRNAANTLAGLSGPPEALVREEPGRGKLNYVRIALGSVRDTLAGPVAEGLGLTVGFNALDGD